MKNVKLYGQILTAVLPDYFIGSGIFQKIKPDFIRCMLLKSVLFTLLFANSCVQPFSPPEVNLDENYLVVDVATNKFYSRLTSIRTPPVLLKPTDKKYCQYFGNISFNYVLCNTKYF